MGIPKAVNMKPADELRHISKEIVRSMAGGLETSQYWGLRLRLIADGMEKENQNGINTTPDAKMPCWICGRTEPRLDHLINVECETPNGKPCPPMDVYVHYGCYMDIEP